MAIKAQKLLEAVKKTTVLSTYLTGAAVAPSAGAVAIYVDLVDADAHRFLEIQTKLKTLFDRAREEEYSRPLTADRFWISPLDGSKSDILSTPTVGLITSGEIAIGIDATVITGDKGSVLLDSCLKQILEHMAENGSITDASDPTITVDDSGTVVTISDSVSITGDASTSVTGRTIADVTSTVVVTPDDGDFDEVDEGFSAPSGVLSEGLNEFVFTAEDSAGKESEETFGITYTPPTVVMQDSGLTVGASTSIIMEGEAETEAGRTIVSVTSSVVVTPDDASWDEPVEPFTAPTGVLSEGLNSFVFTVTDSDGGTGQATFEVTYTP